MVFILLNIYYQEEMHKRRDIMKFIKSGLIILVAAATLTLTGFWVWEVQAKTETDKTVLSEGPLKIISGDPLEMFGKFQFLKQPLQPFPIFHGQAPPCC